MAQAGDVLVAEMNITLEGTESRVSKGSKRLRHVEARFRHGSCPRQRSIGELRLQTSTKCISVSCNAAHGQTLPSTHAHERIRQDPRCVFFD